MTQDTEAAKSKEARRKNIMDPRMEKGGDLFNRYSIGYQLTGLVIRTDMGLMKPVVDPFHTFSMEFAGPFQVTVCANKYVTLAFEKLTG